MEPADRTPHEQQFFDLMDDPASAAQCELPFYMFAVPRLRLYASGRQGRPQIRKGDFCAQLTAVLFVVAYPDAEFHDDYHMSHLQGNIGVLSKFCCAPRFLVHESAAQNALRAGCEARWHAMVNDMAADCMEHDDSIKHATLARLAGVLAPKYVCNCHEKPPCIFNIAHPHLQVLLGIAKAAAKKPRLSKSEAALIREADKAELLHPGFERTDLRDSSGRNAIWKCIQCGHSSTLRRIKSAKPPHGLKCERPKEE